MNYFANKLLKRKYMQHEKAGEWLIFLTLCINR